VLVAPVLDMRLDIPKGEGLVQLLLIRLLQLLLSFSRVRRAVLELVSLGQVELVAVDSAALVAVLHSLDQLLLTEALRQD